MDVLYDVAQPHIAEIKLNRPAKLNAISTSLENELHAAVRRACADEAVRVVIFSGEGRAFCAGWDLSEPDPNDADSHPLSFRAGQSLWLDILQMLRRPDKLFLVAAHGWVAGQGVELCLASDLLVCPESTKFYFAEVRVGFNMASGSAKLLPQLVGLANARRLALFGQTIDGREAHRIGMVGELAAEGEHQDTARRLAIEALKGAPLAVAAQKALIDSALEMSLAATRQYEIETSFHLARTADHEEAKRAFAAKEEPVFSGR